MCFQTSLRFFTVSWGISTAYYSTAFIGKTLLLFYMAEVDKKHCAWMLHKCRTCVGANMTLVSSIHGEGAGLGSEWVETRRRVIFLAISRQKGDQRDCGLFQMTEDPFKNNDDSFGFKHGQ